MDIQKNLVHTLCAAILAGGWLWAGTSVQAAPRSKRLSFPLGPGLFYPILGANVHYEDNILSQPDGSRSSLVTTAWAGGREEIIGDFSRYAAELRLTDNRYLSSTADNSLDGRALLEAAAYPTERVSGMLRGGYERLHVARGQGALEGEAASQQAHPDVYDLWTIDGTFGYGFEHPRAPKLELLAGYETRQYQNNREFTESQDRHTAKVGATFKYMIMPATSLLLGGIVRNIGYDSSVSQRDSDEYEFLGGLTWEATAATTGYIKAGWQSKRFDSASREDANQSAWDVGIKWSPLSYSRFELATARRFDESPSTGDFIDRRDVRLSWNHDWWSYLTSNIFLSHEWDTYGQSDRQDDTNNLGFAVTYKMRDYLSLGFNYAYIDRNSNLEGLDYDRNSFGLILSLNLGVGL
jgi:hypothetical protein